MSAKWPVSRQPIRLRVARDYDKVKAGHVTMPAKNTAQLKASRKAAPTRKTSTVKRSGRRESWKKALERNLILVGYSPAEAKELVDLAAA
jgi:hypothetical protein